jgi:hypothetical protein
MQREAADTWAGLITPMRLTAEVSKVPQIIKIKREVITTLNVAHLFQRSIIIFQHNPRAH